MRQFQAFIFFLTSMSHFSVLVIGPDPEAQLDPYWELDLPAEELREDYRAVFSVHTQAGKIPAAAAKVLADLETKGHELAPQYRRLLAAGRHEEILQDWFGGDKNAEGDWGYYSNPDAKWDWFVLGGRWHGSLILKPGCDGVLGEGSWWNNQQPRVDQARFGDIDWPATRQSFDPFAVLKHGEWHEQGEMGWFGVSLNEKDEAGWLAEVQRLLDETANDQLVSVFDCHI